MNGEEKEFLSRFETAFNATRDEVQALKQGYVTLQRDISTIGNEIKGLASKIEEKSKTNWPALGLGAAMLPVIGFLLTIYTNNAIAPLQRDSVLNAESLQRNSEAIQRLQTMVQASAEADATSRADRAQINERLHAVENDLAHEVADRRADAAVTRTALGEIETQFHAVSNIENLRAAQQERLNSLIWEGVFKGSRYPNGTFFPPSIFQNSNGSPPLAGPQDGAH